MKVALVYDRVNKWGGAERVLLALKNLFPDAPLYTSVYNEEKAPWAKSFTVHTSYLQQIPFASGAHEYYAVCMPTAFEAFTFDEYDLVISVTSEAAKGIITKPGTKHICYCLTPTRYLWSGYDEYFSSGVFRAVATPAISYLRNWDTIAAQRPDVMVGISDEVKKRIKTYYDRDAEVIYPPLTPLKKDSKQVLVGLPEKFFLVVSRLVSYKRVDLAVRACTALHVPLIVIGTGNEEKALRAMAGPSVQFLGNLTDEQLATYYERCQALLFPGVEDFGLTVVEAQYHGKPVIAYGKGGALETIVSGKTGIFFEKQTVSSLKLALESFATHTFHTRDMRAQAEKFSRNEFDRAIKKLIEKTV